ncbi:MAG: hypothetical protein AAGK04_07230 [Planctomycetota bacterium]
MPLVRPITLVVGAGGSVPFGLPTGAGLTDLIGANEANPVDIGERIDDPELRKRLRNRYQRLSREFMASGCPSIDRFIMSRKDEAEDAKRCIAAALLPKEAAWFEAAPIHRTWLSWLFEKAFEPRSGELAEDIRIITFNYDRIIEFAFGTMVATRLGDSLDYGQEIADSLQIRHVYGKLGGKVSASNGHLRVPVNNYSIGESVRDITLVREGSQYAAEKRLYASWIRESESVVFLGFGFDPDNLDAIGFSDWSSQLASKRVIASAYGLLDSEREEVQLLLGRKAQLAQSDDDCLFTLRRLGGLALQDPPKPVSRRPSRRRETQGSDW